ncbi:MAG: hypothetical protein N2647_05510 [Thermodesulfovibrio sp.]|nr:hypothetical protein [Thermodesulfovibrio sp.]
MFNIYIVLQPRSIYATTVYADTMIEAVQSQLFAQLGMNIYLQANIYSYMEFKKEYDYPGIDVKNECDIAKIVTNKKIGRDTVTTGVIEFDYRDIPAFLKEAAG